MPLIGCDGIQQTTATTDLKLTSTKDLIGKLGTNTGSTVFKVTDSSDATCISVDSKKNLKVFGNLYTYGTHFVSNTEEVDIGDKAITLNSEITHSGQNTYGGMNIKNVSNAVGEILVASAFTAGSGTITIAGGPGTLIAGDLIYVNGSLYNDGLYKVASADAVSIVINAAATEYDVKTALVDETVTANISEATPAVLVYDAGWKLGKYAVNAVLDSQTIVGFSSIEAGVSFSATHPNIGCEGATAPGSGASQVGVNNAGLDMYTSTPENLQEFAQETNDLIKETVDFVDGVVKSGSASVSNGASTVAVVFSTAYTTSCTTVICTMRNVTDPTPLHYTIELTTIAKTGFTATLSDITDSANYLVDWIAIGS